MFYKESLEDHLATLLGLIEKHPEYVLTDEAYRFEDCNELYVCRDKQNRVAGYFPVLRVGNRVSNIGIIAEKGSRLLFRDLDNLLKHFKKVGVLRVDFAAFEGGRGQLIMKQMMRSYVIKEYSRRTIPRGVIVYYRGWHNGHRFLRERTWAALLLLQRRFGSWSRRLVR